MGRPFGISFETLTEAPADALPRMDIAAFVGLAGAGPIDTPVPIEDIERYRTIFGADPDLAWDAARGEMDRALLGPSVEAFFAGGGRRCWVVRAAAGAVRHSYTLPELVSAVPEAPGPAVLRARSAGSWGEGITVGTTLRTTALLPIVAAGAEEATALASDGSRIDVAAPPGYIAPYDVLSIGFEPAGVRLFIVVGRIELIDRGLRLVAGQRLWAQATETLGDAIHDERSQMLGSLSQQDGQDAFAAWQADGSGPPRNLIIERLRLEITVWQDGQLINRLGDLALASQHPRFFGRLPTDEVLFAPLTGRLQPIIDPAVQALFSEAGGDRPSPRGPRIERFPIAGPAAAAAFYIPSAMSLVRRASRSVGPDAGFAVDHRVQDGVASLSADMFLDPQLVDYGGDALLRTAEVLYAGERLGLAEMGEGRSLRGLHAILPVAEVTMLSVPDAVHRQATTDAADRPDLLAAPVLDAPGDPDDAGRLPLVWSAVQGATGYRLEADGDPDFPAPVQVTVGAVTAASFPVGDLLPGRLYVRVGADRYGEPGPWSNTRLVIFPPADFDRCAAPVIGEAALSADLPSIPDGAPVLSWQGPAGNDPVTFHLQVASDALFLSAEDVAINPDAVSFAVPSIRSRALYYRVRAEGAGGAGPWSTTIVFDPTGTATPTLVGEDRYDDRGLLAIHRAALRLAGARGDMVALLTVPRHYRLAEVLDHLAALSPDQQQSEIRLDGGNLGNRPLTLGEASVMSYGALFHPWIARRPAVVGNASDTALPPIFLPADGAVAGRMADTAIERGAWIASANRPLAGVVALEPALSQRDADALSAAQVNTVRRDPRGFILVNWETLSLDGELQSLSARRLMILLKRLALREGTALVFEPLTSDLPERVQSRFEDIFASLLVRGAFAAETQDGAYAVITDASVNTPQSLDLGRLIVELRVAPSRPLAFLTIRLIQTGPDRISVGEA